jgi:3D (Asp-Asp-Asp) domain-containing protein
VLLVVLAGALGVGGGSALGGASVDHPYRLRVDAVAYHLPGNTALGIPVRKGVVAVDPRLIPLGTRLHVPGYGPAIAADVGVAIKGRIIDLWMPSTKAARQWGRRTVRITVYR